MRNAKNAGFFLGLPTELESGVGGAIACPLEIPHRFPGTRARPSRLCNQIFLDWLAVKLDHVQWCNDYDGRAEAAQMPWMELSR
jgi:hypothetical protein